MEVMLEIYRTLKALRMEWKPKKRGLGSGGGGEEDGDEDPKKRRRREEEDRVKKAQELYYVETRCRMDDVMVCVFVFSTFFCLVCWLLISLGWMKKRFEWIFSYIELMIKTTSSISAT